MTSRPHRSNWKTATRAVHAGTARSPHGETSEALFLTQGFTYESAEEARDRFTGDAPGFVYSRYANPTVAMFEERMAALEGAEGAFATASGMAAVSSALLCGLRAGDHVVAARALFGSCRWVVETLMPRLGIATTLVDGRDLQAWTGAVRDETKLFFLESPTNPTLELCDIAGVAAIAEGAGARLIVDNVFATPLHQHPLRLGAHGVVYSTTKHVDGQGRCLGGVVLSDRAWLDEHFYDYFRHTGPSMSPFNAWVMLKGLETMVPRVEVQTRNAARIADWLAAQAGLTRVLYPGRPDHPQADIAARQMEAGSTLVAFEVKGGREAAFALENALSLVAISNNLGDAKSLITHPATTTHKNLAAEARGELGITEGLLRLSVGLEDADDLIADLEAGLTAARAAASSGG